MVLEQCVQLNEILNLSNIKKLTVIIEQGVIIVERF